MSLIFAYLRSLWGWRKGIAFRCKKCGTCCSWPGSVFFTSDELAQAARAKGLSEEEFCERFRARRFSKQTWVISSLGGCPLLAKDRTCSIYEARPLQCSSYPFWRSRVKNRAARLAFFKECPGSRFGPWHNWREIERRIALDRRNEDY